MLSRSVTSSRIYIFEPGHDPRTGALSFSDEPVPAQVTQIRGQHEGTPFGHKSPRGTWDMVSFAPGLSSLGLVLDTQRGSEIISTQDLSYCHIKCNQETVERSRRSLKGKKEESLDFLIPGYLKVYSSALVCKGNVMGQNSLDLCWALPLDGLQYISILQMSGWN